MDYSLFNDPGRKQSGPGRAVRAGSLPCPKAMQGWFGYPPVCGSCSDQFGFSLLICYPFSLWTGGSQAFLATAGLHRCHPAGGEVDQIRWLWDPFSFILVQKHQIPFTSFPPGFCTWRPQRESFYAYWRRKTRKLQLLKEKGLLPARVWLIDAKRRPGGTPVFTG